MSYHPAVTAVKRTHHFLKAGTLRRVALLYLVLTSTLLVVNDAFDTEVVGQEIHSSAHTHTPPIAAKMTHFIVTGGFKESQSALTEWMVADKVFV